VETPGHVLDEASLADAGRALEEDRDLLLVGGLEEFDLIGDREVVRLFRDPEVFHRDLLVVLRLF